VTRAIQIRSNDNQTKRAAFGVALVRLVILTLPCHRVKIVNDDVVDLWLMFELKV
jgi:hypothetical protein